MENSDHGGQSSLVHYPSGTAHFLEQLEPACGMPESKTDCNRSYEVDEISSLVSKQQGSTTEDKDAQQHVRQQAALEACSQAGDSNSISDYGGWCYKDHSKIVPKGSDSDEEFPLPINHVQADKGFVEALVNKVLLKQDGSCCSSITDLGAGVGQFGHAFRALHSNISYQGFDGAGNVENYTGGYVKFADLTLPVYANRTDWVISSEVGEHINNMYEKQFLANIHALNCKGVILTWAILGQGGHGHVNCHSNEYLIRIFESLGYTHNTPFTDTLRNATTTSGWLAHSTMVFVRNKSECDI